LIRKGEFDKIKQSGLASFSSDVASVVPFLGDRMNELKSWDQIKLLTVRVDRLRQWYRPGLLCLGDAAHAMSPIGGIGINLAIQDAVAAANILAKPLASGQSVDTLLPRVQERRLFPTRIIQSGQKAAQDNIIGRVLSGGPIQVPALIRLLDRYPLLRRIPGRIIGLGIRRERVKSPKAYA
jgi:2-polyprenyl-6-methoxyphenol hydroxylase-like FAD-dependent oxidoreductase